MHYYRVMERWSSTGTCRLLCSRGRLHAVRVLSALPPLDARLRGDKPHLGFGLLQCVGSGATFRLIFESINEAGLAAQGDSTWRPEAALGSIGSRTPNHGR